jgi:hypothetical protein
MMFLAFSMLLLPVAAIAQEQRAAASALMTRVEEDELLLNGSVVGQRIVRNVTRITLDNGKRRHDATVETEDGTTPSRRNYKFNVAAYELDKVLGLNLVAPSVVRTVNGQSASVTWWVDDVVMAESDRRSKKIEPPDPESWNKQMQAVRVFDELVSNPYRNINPERVLTTGLSDGPLPNYTWGELLITRDWRIWLVDHSGTFRSTKQLQHPQSLTRCDRTLLRRLRELNQQTFQQKLGKYLSSTQMDALEARRAMIVRHFEEQITSKGDDAVLYDLLVRPR